MELLLKSAKSTLIKQPIILAVDDDEDNLLLLTEALKPISSSIITALNGEMAVTLAQDYQPDLILLDVMLPDFNGMEVVRRLKNNPQTMLIRVIAVTALAREEDRQNFILAGCDDYISKPYMLDELETVIYRHLNLNQSVA